MKQKTSLNIKKRVFAGIAVSALALATVAGAVNFSAIADAAKGILNNAAEYGERLGDHTPEQLLGTDYSGWDWVDPDDTYFGKPGNQKFVIRNAATDAAATAYKEVAVPVQQREITPVVKFSVVDGPVANYVTTIAKANIDDYKRTVTVTAGTGGTVSGSGDYVIGSTATIAATPNAGYKFKKLIDSAGNTVQTALDNSGIATATVLVDNNNKTYSAVFSKPGTMAIRTTLPENSGDVSIMTLSQLFFALRNSGNSYNTYEYRYDPNYDSVNDDDSQVVYYVYAINDTAGEDDSLLSTADNLQTIGVDWYNELNKPTTHDNQWTIGGHKLFGGPLECVSFNYHQSTYGFSTKYMCSDDYNYWNSYVPGTTCVAVVRSEAAYSEPLEDIMENGCTFTYPTSGKPYITLAGISTEPTTSLPTKIGQGVVMKIKDLYAAYMTIAKEDRYTKRNSYFVFANGNSYPDDYYPETMDGYYEPPTNNSAITTGTISLSNRTSLTDNSVFGGMLLYPYDAVDYHTQFGENLVDFYFSWIDGDGIHDTLSNEGWNCGVAPDTLVTVIKL